MADFYGGTLINYLGYLDDRKTGKFKLKEHEDVFGAYSRWFKEERG